jgi:class 3 adenylate cyclase/tetratricopeptide (TPR) repeat protein
MNCHNCSHDNSPGSLVCASCGVALAGECPFCATRYPHGQKFCGECGRPLASSSAAPIGETASSLHDRVHQANAAVHMLEKVAGERKQVTVLFADIKGSMELLAGRDPEDANRLLDNSLHRMMDAVHQFLGTVSQARGDGIMALFGAPVAQEDHAVRACLAALKIQESIAAYSADVMRTDGVPLRVRVGIHSGEVVVRSMRNDVYTEYTAVGETTHLAARMEQIANPGTILATGETVRLARGYVTVRPLGALSVKGMPGSVDAFEVTGSGATGSRLKASRQRDGTAFIGRGAEMADMIAALRLARAGDGRIVAVSGEAGVGKSRLVREFVQCHEAADCLLLSAHATSFADKSPYFPVLALLREYFDLAEFDPPEAVREKVVARIMASAPAMLDELAPIFQLLQALPPEHPFFLLDAGQRQEAVFRALGDLLISESRRRPLLLTFDDLQWMDASTLRMLNSLHGVLRGNAVLLVVAYRNEFNDGWGGRHGYVRVALRPLDIGDYLRLLDDMLGDAPEMDGIKEFLVDRAGGNPFFTEEIVRSFAEDGVLAGKPGARRQAKPLEIARMPSTLHSVVASRIDRLALSEKRVLQCVAVVGASASLELLAAMCGLGLAATRQALTKLENAGFLAEVSLHPSQIYAFKQAITRDVVYSGMLREAKLELHANVVRSMETVYADRLPGMWEQLGSHALRGKLWSKASRYSRQAGERAAENHAYVEAVQLFRQALEAVQRLPDDRPTLETSVDLRFQLRNALQPLGDRDPIEGLMKEAEALAIKLKDRRRIGWARCYLTDFYWIRGMTAEAEESGETALKIGRELDDLPMQVVTNLPLGLLHHTRGDYRKAVEYFGWNADRLAGGLQYERFGLFVIPSSFSLSFQAWSLAELGDYEAATRLSRDAAAIAQAADHPISAGYAQLGIGIVQLRQENLAAAIEAFERALAIDAFARSSVGVGYVSFHLGYALAKSGRLEQGFDILRNNVELAVKAKLIARHSLRLAYLSEVQALKGNQKEAEATSLEALRMARVHHEKGNEAFAMCTMGEVALLGGYPLDAEAAFRNALRVASELGLAPVISQANRGLARALSAAGRNVAARGYEEAQGEQRTLAG